MPSGGNRVEQAVLAGTAPATGIIRHYRIEAAPPAGHFEISARSSHPGYGTGEHQSVIAPGAGDSTLGSVHHIVDLFHLLVRESRRRFLRLGHSSFLRYERVAFCNNLCRLTCRLSLLVASQRGRAKEHGRLRIDSAFNSGGALYSLGLFISLAREHPLRKIYPLDHVI